MPVELAISRRAEIKAMFGFKPRVAIVNHGNTVNHTEYNFIGDVLATQGYLVVSIQHDLKGDPPLSMVRASRIVGRHADRIERGEKNILFAIDEIKKRLSESQLRQRDHVRSLAGGDIAMYLRRPHPDLVNKIVTLDNCACRS